MLTIAICKGRPYNGAVKLLNQAGYFPELLSDDERCYTYKLGTKDDLTIKYVMISPRDMPVFSRKTSST